MAETWAHLDAEVKFEIIVTCAFIIMFLLMTIYAVADCVFSLLSGDTTAWEVERYPQDHQAHHRGRIVRYRTLDARADYIFRISWCGDHYRAYIQSQPSYGRRSQSLHATHRLVDRQIGEFFVCWTEPLRTRADARKVAALWADATQEYIRTGKSF